MRILQQYIALLVLYLLVFGCKKSVPPTEVQSTTITSQVSTQMTGTSSVKLLFVGDVMGHDPQIKSALDAKTGRYNYSDCFKYLEPIISKADIAVANLEVTLPGQPPYVGYPHFRSPNALAKGLKDAGFDVIVTANNHSNDAGKIGVDQTLNTLESQGLLATGTFKDYKERYKNYPLIIDKNGIKVAFLNCTYDTNGMPDIPPTIVNRIDTLELDKDILKAKAAKADVLVVLIHWGKEYKLLPNKDQKFLADWLVSKGVTAVIGSHPHVIQPVETRKSDAADVFITYSLGNFISNQRKKDTEGGLLVEVEFTKDHDEQKVAIQKSSYSLLWRYIFSKNNKSKYYTIPISPFQTNSQDKMAMSKRQQREMIAFATKFRNHLKKNGNVEERKYKFKELFDNKFSKPL